MEEFVPVYDREIRPHLRRLGLVESAEKGRHTRDEYFTRLLELDSFQAIGEASDRLSGDESFTKLLVDLGPRFGTEGRRDRLRHNFSLYRAHLGPGRRTPTPESRRSTASFKTGFWKSYDETDGVAAINVHSVIQDRDGYLWFGTAKGLSRFDGKVWKMFTVEDGLPANDIRSVHQDREGAIWLGTVDGVCRFSPMSGPKVDLSTMVTLTHEDGPGTSRVNTIAEDHAGHLWFGTSSGISRYDGTSFINYGEREGLPGDVGYSNASLVDRDGTLWVGTTDGLFQFDGQRFRRVPWDRDEEVSTIFQDLEGVFWIGTWGGGITRYDGRTFTTYTTADGLADNRVMSSHQDQSGRLWLGTNGGLSKIDLSRDIGENRPVFTSYGLEVGVRYVQDITQDREGTLWLACWPGVIRHEPDTFAYLAGVPDPANDWVLSDPWRMSPSADGGMWLPTGGGISQYTRGELETFDLRGVLDGGQIRYVYEVPGIGLWVGGLRTTELAHFDGNEWKTVRVLVRPSTVRPHLRDRSGSLWVGYGQGLMRIDGQTLTLFGQEDGLPGWNVRSVAEDHNGRLWVGAWRGVCLYDPQSESGGVFRDYSAEVGIPNVHRIVSDRNGHIWAGGLNGLSRFDGTSWHLFTVRDGLAGSRVEWLTTRRKGGVWCGTTAGVGVFDGKVFQKMIKKDGIPVNTLWSVEEDGAGDLWIGTSDGAVTRYRPPPPSPPEVMIDAVIADRRYAGVQEVSFSSVTDLVAIEFNGLSLRTGGLVFRYRLSGHDNVWHNTRDRRVEFHDLPTGSFVFEVVAVNQDLVYSETPATLALTVHPPTNDTVSGRRSGSPSSSSAGRRAG